MQEDGFCIEPLSEHDAEAILGVYRQCEDFLALGPLATASMGMVLEDLKHSREMGGVFCGIDTPGGLAGIVDYVPDCFNGEPGVAFLSLLMIAREHRGGGLGARVVRAVEAEIVKRGGIRAIRSGVQVNNPGAIRFWLRQGYCVTGGPVLFSDQTTGYDLSKDVHPLVSQPDSGFTYRR